MPSNTYNARRRRMRRPLVCDGGNRPKDAFDHLPSTLNCHFTWTVTTPGMEIDQFHGDATLVRIVNTSLYALPFISNEGFIGTLSLALNAEPATSIVTVTQPASQLGAYILNGTANGWPGDLLTGVNPFVLSRGVDIVGSGDWKHP
jgi:hypothetical protein